MSKNRSRLGFRHIFVPVAAAMFSLLVGSARGQETHAPSADAEQGMPAFDDIMNDFLKSRHIPGGALAIAKDGKLRLARGYGAAILQSRDAATADTLFCTASITKTITSVALLHLVDQGKLSLDDAVYPILGKPRPLGRSKLDSDVEKITVRQLLLHSGGWNSRQHTDYLHQTQKIARAAGEKLPLSAESVLRYGLSQPLDFVPGSESRYSDFGYFVAKLVVERSARQPYESYVRQHVLKPMGISQMRMEQLSPAYAAREAHRYNSGGRELIGGREPIAAPAGSWLGSVVDIARFLTTVSGTRGKPFLSSAARQQMLAVGPPPLAKRRSGSHVGLGWDSVTEAAGGVQFHKTGSIPGIRTYIEHRADGVDLVLLLNSDGQADGATQAVPELVDKLHQEMDATRDWPDRDLFEAPAPPPAPPQKPKGTVVL
jgi:N-acyl-D-amino-acid deacylase